MTRREIEKKAFEIYSPAGMGFDGAENEREAFIEGAEWMQEHMIKSVRQYVHSNWVGGDTYVFDLSDLIKSMKGE